MDRTNLILLVALVLAVATGLLLERPAATRLSSGPVFAGFEPGRAARVELVLGDERLVLVRDGERWRLPDLFEFPVAPTRVERGVLEQLQRLSRADLAGASREGFQLDDPLRVRVLDGAGRELVALDQSTARLPAGGGTFLSPRGADEVYRSVALPLLEPTPRLWWDGRVLPGFDGDASRLELDLRTESGRRRFEFARGEDGRFRRRVDGGTAEPASGPPIEAALQLLAGLRLSGVVAGAAAPEHGVDDPAAVLAVTPRGASEPLVVTVGASDGERLFATSSALERPFVLALDPGLLDEVLSRLASQLTDR